MIELEDVWKRFGERWILKGVKLRLERGIYALVGDNGTGKTTLLKIVAGLIKPSRGVVKILGKDLRKFKDYKRFLGVLLHENVLYEELTVGENLKFYAKAYGVFSDLAREVFDDFGLERFENSKVKELSFGWKKRVNFVRALINDPKIVLLDEPFAGLDDVARETVKELMLRLSKDRVVVFTSPTASNFKCKLFKIEDGVVHD
ncbi:ABC transporter ATP-binding protein [Archaeoglobus sp.]